MYILKIIFTMYVSAYFSLCITPALQVKTLPNLCCHFQVDPPPPTSAMKSYPRIFLSYLLFSDCGLPAIPSNGSFALDSGVTTYGSTATRKCNPGYVSIGLATIQCKVDGTWADRPFTCSLAGIN